MKLKQKKRTYRFLPAYTLLFLAENDLYGSAVLGEFRRRMPGYSADSAVVYRTLQEMEKEGLVVSYWKTETPGPATKWYRITDSGRKSLAEYRMEIEQRKQNLEFFLRTYQSLERR